MSQNGSQCHFEVYLSCVVYTAMCGNPCELQSTSLVGKTDMDPILDFNRNDHISRK